MLKASNYLTRQVSNLPSALTNNSNAVENVLGPVRATNVSEF